MSGYTPVEKLEVFVEFQAIADWCWNVTDSMKPFHLWTIGKQLVTAADSVCANLLEGGNRQTSGDQLHFFVMASASAEELRYWVRRARAQSAVIDDEAADWDERLAISVKKLGSLIAYRRSQRHVVREEGLIALYPRDSDEVTI